jgi:hypothetical protein
MVVNQYFIDILSPVNKKHVWPAFSEKSINCRKSAFPTESIRRNCSYQNVHIKEGAHDCANKLAANVQHSQLMIKSIDKKMQKVQSERRKQFRLFHDQEIQS